MFDVPSSGNGTRLSDHNYHMALVGSGELVLECWTTRSIDAVLTCSPDGPGAVRAAGGCCGRV